METMRMKHRTLRAAMTLLLLIAVSPASFAQQFEPSWRLGFDLAFVDPTGDNVTVGVNGDRVDIAFDSQAGVGIRLEYQFARSLAAEIGFVGTAGIDVAIGDLGNTTGVSTRVSSFTPVTAGVNYHFTPDSRVNLYAGPFLAIVRYGDIEVEVGTGGVAARVSVDSDLGWGAIAGLEVPVGSGHWSLQSNVRYVHTRMSGTSDGDRFDGNFNPFVLSIGFGYRF